MDAVSSRDFMSAFSFSLCGEKDRRITGRAGQSLRRTPCDVGSDERAEKECLGRLIWWVRGDDGPGRDEGRPEGLAHPDREDTAQRGAVRITGRAVEVGRILVEDVVDVQGQGGVLHP